MISVTVNADAIADGGDRIREGVTNAIHAAGQAGFAESQRQVPVAFGDLKKSGELRRGPGFAQFGYDSEYARPVEKGSEPHYPPIEPLKEWAELVLGDRQAAYPVQQKIAEEGTPAQPYMGPGFQAAVRELKRRGLSPSIEGQL